VRDQNKVFSPTTWLLVYLVGGDLVWSPLLWSGGSRSVSICYKFDVRSFKLIQGFNGDDFGFGALVLRGTYVHEDFPTVSSNVRLTPVWEWRLRRVGGSLRRQ
jgi:hypothetical protein